MDAYLPRLTDGLLQRRLRTAGAVLLEGAKWCGKSTTARRLAGSVISLQDPDTQEQNRLLAETKPSLLLEGEVPRLLDEWQDQPQLWDAVRHAVDQRGAMGQFILTGSAVPADRSKIRHSGAGRFARLLMRPMSLFESQDSTGKVSLRGLFEGNQDIAERSTLTLEDLAFLICRGGWPQAIGLPRTDALDLARQYVDVVTASDISRADGVARDRALARRLLRSYARCVGSQTPIATIQADLAANEEVSVRTVNAYLSALRQIFVVEESAAWSPNLRSKTAIRTTDTRYFVDPSIGAVALRVGPEGLLKDIKTMGLLFENLAIRDLRAYAESLEGEVFHYRDKNDLECDAVITLRHSDAYGLVEVKLGGTSAIEAGIATLNKVESILDTEKMGKPAFKLLLTGFSEYAYQRPDGVILCPIGCLGA